MLMAYCLTVVQRFSEIVTRVSVKLKLMLILKCVQQQKLFKTKASFSSARLHINVLI